MKKSFYEFLEEREREILADSRVDPIRTKDFQLKLIDLLQRSKRKDKRINKYKGVILSGKRKLIATERHILKKIFIDHFYNKDPATYSDPLPHVYRRLDTSKRKHYVSVENSGS